MDSKTAANTKCDLKEDPVKGIVVSNLSDVVVENEDQMDDLLNKGLTNRTVGSTLMNAESSRSHSIFTIVVEMNNKDSTGKDHICAGKLNLVDLAGSERQKKTGATGDRLKEGSKINLSLSALGNVIAALSDGGGKHIPYRDSKLTRMLQDSLGGNTKTLMVAAISPADYNYDETLSTLRYANRAKSIKNKPKINEDPKDTMLREFKEEIERLKKLLSQQQADSSALLTNYVGSGGQGNFIANIVQPVDNHSHSNSNSNSSVPNILQQNVSPDSMSIEASEQSSAIASNHHHQQQQHQSQHQQQHYPPNEPRSSAAEKSPRMPPQRIVEKQIVEVRVEVDRIPQEHLNRQRVS